MSKRINLCLVLLFAAVSLWCADGLMRKCDQAAILAGANDLAHGRARPWETYYQVDKTYVLYGVCAAALKAVPNLDPVTVGNMTLALIFWTALTVFVLRFGDKIHPALLLCFLAAPAVLFNTMYVNSTVLSSAFLLLSARYIFSKSRASQWAAAVFFFLSVGSRADIILLLPIILWLITPFQKISEFLAECSRGWKTGLCGLGTFSKQWKLLFAGALALVTGPLMTGGAAVALDPIFNWKMVAGYTVFGFGAAGVLWAVQAGGLAWRTVKATTGLEKLYGAAGLIAFLLPVVFFMLQLHAPRYFWRGCEALLLLAVSGRALFVINRRLVVVLCVVAILPLLWGVRLPSLTRPQFTISEPTLFPSGDGYYPMGGYASFLLKLGRADSEPIDHNQMVWQAVRSAEFDVAPDGSIPVLFTPMYGYFLLEASLRGGAAECLPLTALEGAPFYVDSRSLMRDDPKSPLRELNQILGMPSRFVSPVSGGIGVLQVGRGDNRWARQTTLLNRLFAGNEYRVFSKRPLNTGTRQVVCFSDKPFEHARRDAVSGLYYLKEPGLGIRDLSCAVAVFPGWMSMQAFSGN